MKDKLIIKRVTDGFYHILEKHNNPQWAIDELEWLIFQAHRGEYEQLNFDEKHELHHCMNVLKQVKLY